jgi:hypothetical protein
MYGHLLDAHHKYRPCCFLALQPPFPELIAKLFQNSSYFTHIVSLAQFLIFAVCCKAMISALTSTNLQLGAIGFVLIILFAYVLNKLTTWEHTIPNEVQWIDRRKQPLSYLRAKARALARSKENVLEAYSKVCSNCRPTSKLLYLLNLQFNKFGKAAALAVPFGRPLLILPPTFIRWIVDQPESVISLDPIHDEFHVFVGGDLTGDHSVQELLRRELTLNLDNLTSVINEEIVCALDDVLGHSSEWKTTPLAEDLKTIVARTSNRVFVGKDLCKSARPASRLLLFQ